MVIKAFYNLVDVGVPVLTLCLNCQDLFLIIVISCCRIGKVRPIELLAKLYMANVTQILDL